MTFEAALKKHERVHAKRPQLEEFVQPLLELRKDTRAEKLIAAVFEGQVGRLYPALKAIFIHDAPLMKEVRLVLEDILRRASDLPASERRNWYIDQCLCVYAQLSPQNRATLNVFQRDYTISNVPLFNGYSAMLLECDEQEPIVVLKGTTFPAGEGFWQTIRSDIHLQGHSVGYDIFRNGYDAIAALLEKRRVRVIGQSLGASLACLLAIYFPQNVSSVGAYVCPGLEESDLNEWKAHDTKVDVLIHGRDRVSWTGHGWHRDWKVKKVLSEVTGMLGSHAALTIGLGNIALVEIDSEKEKRQAKHRWTRWWHTALANCFHVKDGPYKLYGRLATLPDKDARQKALLARSDRTIALRELRHVHEELQRPDAQAIEKSRCRRRFCKILAISAAGLCLACAILGLAILSGGTLIIVAAFVTATVVVTLITPRLIRSYHKASGFGVFNAHDVAKKGFPIQLEP